ncbi:SDR family oxidoreductase [Paraflavitalea pollutisoli]|uniref:SDR family oxidoreductase n=1 Tax=Paraflavitalea pollutisoli TaxID=3034143 RepID=UPI0023EB592D|nr:SDR family oxidoreductase [Paraflavitalea sp. H1-2-19X]
MRVFVTGATGFVGSAVVAELLQAGHEVLGLARTDEAATALQQAGAAVHRGNLQDPDSIAAGVANVDAVIHTAFNHDFSRYAASCEEDRQLIHRLGAALAGTNRPLIVTSGIGVLNKSGQLITEQDVTPPASVMPRAATEEAARAIAAQGVRTYIVRLPHTVHGRGDHGFVPILVGLAKEKGASAWIGEGQNVWPAVHRLDAAVVYRLIVEQQPEKTVFHAVQEGGIPFRQIATTIGQGLSVPAVTKNGVEAEQYFGWFKHFAAMDCPASSEQTRQVLGWEPRETGLLKDLVSSDYF